MTGLEMFQPTHPHGVRPICPGVFGTTSAFQPTHPHGVRLGYLMETHTVFLCFNPRTRTGCDGVSDGNSYCLFLFQPTHPHGVRHYVTHFTFRYS